MIFIGGGLVKSAPALELESLYAVILAGMVAYGAANAGAIWLGAWQRRGTGSNRREQIDSPFDSITEVKTVTGSVLR